MRTEHDDQAAARLASQRDLPSVEDWIAAGGVVETLTDPPRVEAMIGPVGGMRRLELRRVDRR